MKYPLGRSDFVEKPLLLNIEMFPFLTMTASFLLPHKLDGPKRNFNIIALTYLYIQLNQPENRLHACCLSKAKRNVAEVATQSRYLGWIGNKQN
jgi:hypothetical protein